MNRASGKLGRGVGSAGKRNIHAPPIRRPASAGRLSLGRGGGVLSAAVSNGSAPSLVEESFSLVRENPLNFGMAIKLAPNLVKEIKLVEAQGGTARIKFDAANNPNGNVIQVGDKTFRFTWSREPGNLCDIYEERQSGVDENGLLVESGATWRKLNVERELDESAKNHVKRRSEEAERKLKSRRAIVLDHQTPSMKNQLKGLVAAESNRNFKHRKEPPFKKPKSELPSACGPRSVYKSGLPPTSLSKLKLSSGSPLSSQLEQHGGSVCPGASGNFVKGHTSLPDAAVQNKEKAASSDRELGSRLPNSISDKLKHNQNTEAKPIDLRSLIISLLLKHKDKGLNLKALERAIGDSMPNTARQIESILKQVATFQAPGKYFLKRGAEMGSFKKSSPQIGRFSISSPEISQPESPALQKFDHLPALDPSFSTRSTAKDEEPVELNSTPVSTISTIEKIDILGKSTELFSDKKLSENGGGLAGSSSDGDSSNSGSDGSCRSKSQSPVGSQSGTSSDSDSESDATSSKQASDEDVDIMMSDDDKESEHKLQNSDPVSLKSPLTWNDLDNGYIDIRNCDKQDDHVSDVVEIVNDSPLDVYDAERPTANYSKRQEHDRKSFDGLDHVANYGFKHDESSTGERSSKGPIDDKHSDERAHNRKKLKSQNLSQPDSGTISLLFGESPSSSFPDGALHVPSKVNLARTTSDGSNNVAHASTEGPSGERRPDKPEILDRWIKYSERSLQSNEGLQVHKGLNAETQTKDGLVSEGRPMIFSAKDVGTESNYKKLEMLGKVKKATAHSPGHHIQVGSQLNKGPENSNKIRFAGAGKGLWPSSDSYEDILRRVPIAQQESDSVQGVGSHTTKENKKRKRSSAQDSSDRRQDASLTGHNGVNKNNKESLEAGSFLYEKELPELKGPIKDFSQYREYVKEYQVKYETYSSLNKLLESYREEFSKLGKDLEACKGRDMKRYNEVLEQMRSSFFQCGERHKRLKKIFVVLYEELKHLKQMLTDYAASYKKN